MHNITPLKAAGKIRMQTGSTIEQVWVTLTKPSTVSHTHVCSHASYTIRGLPQARFAHMPVAQSSACHCTSVHMPVAQSSASCKLLLHTCQLRSPQPPARTPVHIPAAQSVQSGRVRPILALPSHCSSLTEPEPGTASGPSSPLGCGNQPDPPTSPKLVFLYLPPSCSDVPREGVRRPPRIEALDTNGHAAAVAALLGLAHGSQPSCEAVERALVFWEAWCGRKVTLHGLYAPPES